MNPMILGFFRILFLALVGFVAAPVSAATTSYLLAIDPLTSSSNISGGFAGFNQNFTLSGTFNAHVTDGIKIQLENIDVVGTALDSSNNQYPPGTVVKFTDFPTFPGEISSIYFSGSIVIDNIQQSYTGTFDGKKMAMKGQVLPLSGADFFTTVYSLNAAVVTPVASPTPTPIPPLSVGDVSITTLRDTMAFWTPVVIDLTMSPMAPTCYIIGLPVIGGGIATVDEYCRSGTYTPPPGFVGNDSFAYQAVKGSITSNIGIVTVAVIDGPVDQICVQNNPVSQFSQTGKEGTLTISFTGNITAHTNKTVKLCPGTPLKYQASSTQGPVVCKVRNNTTRGSGMLKINDHIKCTDKPAGKDKVSFKVKSGVK